MIFGSIDKSKEVLAKFTELWNEIKNQIETINVAESIKHKRDFMKIRLESDDDLPLGKVLGIPVMVVVTGSVFQEGNKYYPQVLLHECVYKSVDKL